jgi:hypothetical protein
VAGSPTNAKNHFDGYLDEVRNLLFLKVYHHMDFSMTGQENGDLLIQVTA